MYGGVAGEDGQPSPYADSGERNPGTECPKRGRFSGRSILLCVIAYNFSDSYQFY
jgi:hypothetical protein